MSTIYRNRDSGKMDRFRNKQHKVFLRQKKGQLKFTKHSFIRLIVWLIVLLLVNACRFENKKNNGISNLDSLKQTLLQSTENVPIKLHIQPQIFPRSVTEIPFQIINNGDYAVSVGHYSILYWNETIWENIPLGYIFADEYIPIRPGELFTGKASLNPEHVYQSGKYKLSSFVNVNLYTEFCVDTVCLRNEKNFSFLQLSVFPEEALLSTDSIRVVLNSLYPGEIVVPHFSYIQYYCPEYKEWIPINRLAAPIMLDTLGRGDSLVVDERIIWDVKPEGGLIRGKYRMVKNVKIRIDEEFILE